MDGRVTDGASNSIVIDCPVRSIEDLAAGIIAAVYAPEQRTSSQRTSTQRTSTQHIHRANPDERPVPRNLDALADLLRETQVNHLVVTDWRIPTELADGLTRVLALEGVQLTRGRH